MYYKSEISVLHMIGVILNVTCCIDQYILPFGCLAKFVQSEKNESKENIKRQRQRQYSATLQVSSDMTV